MSSVTLFKQHLAEQNNIKNKEYYAIYNYLNYFCHDNQKLTNHLFNKFFRKCLLFPYWNTYLNSLYTTLIHQLNLLTQNNTLEFDINTLTNPLLWQLITLQKEDHKQMVLSYLQNNSSIGDKVRVLYMDNNRVLGLILKLNGSLDVLSFGCVALINQGKLEPLSPLSTLYYSDKYELKINHLHIIEGSLLNFINFKIDTHKQITGYYLQDSNFQKINCFKQKQISEINTLNCALKKTESFFIKDSSTPHYKDLVSLLHNHYCQILISPKDHISKTTDILNQAQQSMVHLYPNDQLLLLLTTNINYQFKKQQKKLIALTSC